MPAVLLVSPEPLAGKTTVAVGLARRLGSAGKTVALTRLPGDDHSEADATLFGTLIGGPQDPAKAGVHLIEAPSGGPSEALEGDPKARALVIAGASNPVQELADYCRPLEKRLAGVVINKTPAKRIDAVRDAAKAADLNVVALLPEDRLLAAPVLRDVMRSLSAQAEHLNNGGMRPLDRPVIATISADPGQGYFARYDASAVIVRSDKPDLQLAALNAGASCLIVTGGLPLLSYVLERAEADQIPLLRTGMDTMSAVQRIEESFALLPFAGGEDKIARISALLAGIELASLS